MCCGREVKDGCIRHLEFWKSDDFTPIYNQWACWVCTLELMFDKIIDVATKSKIAILNVKHSLPIPDYFTLNSSVMHNMFLSHITYIDPILPLDKGMLPIGGIY